MRDITGRVLQRAALAGLAIPESVLSRLTRYYDLLRRWNAKINLTSLSEPDEAIDRLLLEPLAASQHIPSGVRLIDLGSGGGSPAIPLALGCAASRLVMVESRGRKAAFLQEAVRHLELSDASVESRRFEDLSGNSQFRGAFDVVSIRAVRIERRTLETAAGFLAAGGLVALFRGLSGPIPQGDIPPELTVDGTVSLPTQSMARLTLLRRN